LKRTLTVSTIVITTLLAAAISFATGVRPALAHTNVEIGPYTVIVGWETEPVVVGERNALFFDVSEDGVPIEGLESTLQVVVLYGGQTFTGNLQPGADAGTYSVEILPTVRGQYSLQLTGMIEDLEISEVVEPEEVLPATVLQFPESPPDTRELQSSIDELTTQLQTARILAIAAILLAVIAIAIAAAGVLRKRR
jgi:hypothetical protein